MKFDPDSKEYEYSNDLSSDSDASDIEEDEDEKISDTLKRYRRTIKKSFHNAYQEFCLHA